MGDLYCESNWVGPEEREASKWKIEFFFYLPKLEFLSKRT